MMPNETAQAIVWALQQNYTDEFDNQVQVTKENAQALVDFVRKYFNENGLQYSTFSYDDLIPYL